MLDFAIGLLTQGYLPTEVSKKMAEELDVNIATSRKYTLTAIDILNGDGPDSVLSRNAVLNCAIQTCLWLYRQAVKDRKFDQALRIMKEKWKLEGLVTPTGKGGPNLGSLGKSSGGKGRPTAIVPGRTAAEIPNSQLAKALEQHGIPVPDQLKDGVAVVTPEQADEIIDANAGRPEQ